MSALLHTLFGWPDGICTGNLIASAIWAAPAVLHLHRHVKKHSALEVRRAEEARSEARAGSEEEGAG